jgi:hypothetical protein
MSAKRLVAAGIAAGLIINVGEFVVEPLMGPQMESFLRRLNLSKPGEGTMLVLAGFALLLGVITVWLYSVMTERYGRGAGTVLRTATAVWALSCALPNVTMLLFGLYDTRLFWFATIWPFVETFAATLGGAKILDRGQRAVVPARA